MDRSTPSRQPIDRVGRRPAEGPRLACRDRQLDLGRPRLMGVLNVTPDSFSDGGEHLDPAAAIARAAEMVADGADILDVGGESTRPGAAPVAEAEELRRVLPVIEGLGPLLDSNPDLVVSIDTSKPAVAREALHAGAHLINDVGGASAPMLEIAAAVGCPIVAMHMRGEPRTMQDEPTYDDVVAEVSGFLAERRDAARRRGVPVILDPGIGFGKTAEHNLELLAHLDVFVALGAPVLVGASRKRFLGCITGRPAGERAAASVGAHLAAVARGASILRVHDVAVHRDALDVWLEVQRQAVRHPPGAPVRIVLEGLRCSARIGVPEEERSAEQSVVLDATLELASPVGAVGSSPARGASDGEDPGLDSTVDYVALATALRELVASRPWILLETLAKRCAEALAAQPGAGAARVRVAKPAVAELLEAEAVAVEATAGGEVLLGPVERSRSS